MPRTISTYSYLRITFLFLFVLEFNSQCISQKIYNLDWRLDGSVLGSAIALYVSDLILFDNPLITFDEINGLDKNQIWSFDRPAIYQFSPSSRTTSDHFRNVLSVAPLALYFSNKMKGNAKEYTVMYIETMALNFGLTQFVKSSVGRVRPFIYNPEIPIEWKIIKTAKRSFFSGHVSHTASLSFLTARVFADLHPDSPLRPVVWASAIVAPALTGYFRYEAGRHFPSDLIIGYAMGAMIGYFMPILHRVKSQNKVYIHGSSKKLGLTVKF